MLTIYSLKLYSKDTLFSKAHNKCNWISPLGDIINNKPLVWVKGLTEDGV